jgi:sulfite reductase beta subunit-like hemoprotein
MKLGDTEACLRRLAQSGLTTREACGNSVRNIVGCPLSGVCQTEAFDISPYAEALTRYFLRHPLSSSLPRKFKISLGGCEPDCAGGAFNDVGLRARVRGINAGAEPGFRVTVGGGTATLCQSGWLVHDFLPAGQILNVVEAVVRLFHAHGNRRSKSNARMKYLIRKIGWEAWKRLYDEQLEAVRAEGKARLPFDPHNPPFEGPPSWERPQAPDEVEVGRRATAAGVQGPGIVSEVVVPTPQSSSTAEFVHFCRTNVHAQHQPGYLGVIVYVPMGRGHSSEFWRTWRSHTATAAYAPRSSRTSCCAGSGARICLNSTSGFGKPV